MIEKTDIGDLKGIGEKTKKLFEKINIHTVGAVSYTHLTLPTTRSV